MRLIRSFRKQTSAEGGEVEPAIRRPFQTAVIEIEGVDVDVGGHARFDRRLQAGAAQLTEMGTVLNAITTRATPFGTSRSCLAYLVASPRLLEVNCRTIPQMRLANALCRFVERAV
jgi:hypothetical protein